MQQVFVEPEAVENDFITVTGDDVKHMKNVLRMKVGERIRVSCSDGRNFFCCIKELNADNIVTEIIEDAPSTELTNKIYLFQALPKGDRMETVIEKAVELGVYEIIPVAMKYCVVKLDEKKKVSKVKRYQAIAESAAKQSKRSYVPQIHPVMSFKEAAKYAADCDVRLVPYENKDGMKATVEAMAKIKPGQSVSIMIGPEGGIAEEEIEMVRDSMDVISLGSRILRTDTAAITTMSMVMLASEEKEL